MLLQVDQFRQWVKKDISSLVTQLQEHTGRAGLEEAQAWRQSLPMLATVLHQSQLQDFHINLGISGSVAIEYRLPASSSWCDAVLLGAGNTTPSAVMIELKDWDTFGDRPGPRAGLIDHQGQYLLHPSEQVRGYVEYCRRFHSTVLDTSAEIAGCTFFTRPANILPYTSDPHRNLVEHFPVFHSSAGDISKRFPQWIAERMVAPDPEFALAFTNGGYRQDRNFVIQVAQSIAEPQESSFVLLDQQREGFQHCMHIIEDLLNDWDSGRKSVVIIEGPPGSGKSVLAAHLWSALIRDERIEGSIVLTTTSGSQRSNWEHLFEQSASDIAGRGLVIPANRYNPGMSPTWVNERPQGWPYHRNRNLERKFQAATYPKIQITDAR